MMAWCRQATNHYLIQYWLGSMSPYGVTKLQWIQHIFHGYITEALLPTWLTYRQRYSVAFTWEQFHKKCLFIRSEFTRLKLLPHLQANELTHWGRVTHICVSNLTIIGSDNGLSPRRRQAIIWTNAGIILIGPLGTKFSEILIEIVRVSSKKMRLKGSSAKWRPFCLGLNVYTRPLQRHSKTQQRAPYVYFLVCAWYIWQFLY